ncbi:MAG: tetratricopeptide repeat protein [Bdellovibrionales bacterium]|nr:tetratricopeptide repeat protein [Bdellovibrionales bacterium]
MLEMIGQEPLRQNEAPQRALPPRPKLSIDIFTLVQNAKVLIKHGELRLARHLLRESLQKDPKNVYVLKTLADCLDKLNQWDEAEKVLKALCQQEVNFPNLSMRAHNHYKLGQDHLALQSYFEALALVTDDIPELYEIYKNVGNIFVRQGDFESAEENYNKAYTRASNSDVLLVNYGTLEVQRGDLDKALFCFRKAVEVNPLNDRAWVGLGMIHSHFGDFELAWGNLIKASDINPENRTALILLAQWSTQMNSVDTVIERFVQYFSKVSEDSELSILLIKLFIEKSEYYPAHLEFVRAICFDPQNQELQKLNEVFSKLEINQ